MDEDADKIIEEGDLKKLGKLNFMKLLEKSGYIVSKDTKINDIDSLSKGYDFAGKPIKARKRPWVPTKIVKLTQDNEILDSSDCDDIY